MLLRTFDLCFSASDLYSVFVEELDAWIGILFEEDGLVFFFVLEQWLLQCINEDFRRNLISKETSHNLEDVKFTLWADNK